MAEVKLTAQEAAVLAALLRKIVVRDRTGDVGVVHGMDRFVAAELILKKRERADLDTVTRKLGIGAAIARTET
jgi:hypothetical protein